MPRGSSNFNQQYSPNNDRTNSPRDNLNYNQQYSPHYEQLNLPRTSSYNRQNSPIRSSNFHQQFPASAPPAMNTEFKRTEEIYNELPVGTTMNFN